MYKMARKFDYRKNLLDLNYQKYLQYKIITLIFLFTYFIALIVAFLTNQLSITDKNDLSFVSILSIVIIAVGYSFLRRFNYHLKKIPKEIKKISKS